MRSAWPFVSYNTIKNIIIQSIFSNVLMAGTLILAATSHPLGERTPRPDDETAQITEISL